MDFTKEEADIICTAGVSKNGEAFCRLYDGHYDGYPSRNAAEQALLEQLLFWSKGNTKMADSLFRQSGLHRPDWDEPFNGTTCGRYMMERTIQKLKE